MIKLKDIVKESKQDNTISAKEWEKVEKTITFLLSYMSETLPTGNWDTAPETANKNVTIEISKIEKFIEVA